jgi:hypothetical protein
MPVSLVTQEAEIRRIVVWSQPRWIVCESLSQKNTSQESAGGVALGVGPEFKLQYCKRKTKDESALCKFPKESQSDSINLHLGSLFSTQSSWYSFLPQVGSVICGKALGCGQPSMEAIRTALSWDKTLGQKLYGCWNWESKRCLGSNSDWSSRLVSHDMSIEPKIIASLG